MSEQNFQRQQDVHDKPAYEDPLAELARIVAGEEPIAPEKSQSAAELTPGSVPDSVPDSVEETEQDLPQHMDQHFLSDDSHLGERLTEENMDLESQLMAELSGEAVPIVTDRPEEIPQPQEPESENDAENLGQPVEHENFSQQIDDLAGSQVNFVAENSPSALNTALNTSWQIETELATARAETGINADQSAPVASDIDNVLDQARDDDAVFAQGNENDAGTSENKPAPDDQFDLAAAFQNELEQAAVSRPVENITPQASPVNSPLASPQLDRQLESPAISQPDQVVPPLAAMIAPALDLGQPERQIEDSVHEIQEDLVDGMNIEEAFADVFANEISMDMGVEQAETTRQQSQLAPDASGQIVQPDVGSSAPNEAGPVEPEGEQKSERKSSGFRLAATALGVAILTGTAVVAYGLLSQGVTNDDPVLVRADQSDFKVKPAKPGGKEIANQDQPVYDTMAKNNSGNNSGNNLGGDINAKPGDNPVSNLPEAGQDKLIASNQVPVEIVSKPKPPAERTLLKIDAEPAMAVKSAERLATGNKPSEKNIPIAFVKPRKVKTVTVRADGTIVTPISAEIAPLASAVIGQGINQAAGKNPIDGATSTGKVAIPSKNPSKLAGVLKSSVTNSIRKTAVKKPIVVKSDLPGLAEPVKLETNGVASVSAPKEKIVLAPPSIAPFAVQISSQRSLEAAEASYQNLKRRYASLLNGRAREIREGKLEGKGVYYRVRIPFVELAAANDFCTRYKSAGGSCFVTR